MSYPAREHVGGVDSKSKGDLQAFKVLGELPGDFCFQEELAEGGADVEILLLVVFRRDGVKFGYDGLVEGQEVHG